MVYFLRAAYFLPGGLFFAGRLIFCRAAYFLPDNEDTSSPEQLTFGGLIPYHGRVM